MATMDGGKTRFPKHFTRLVLFENEKLFDQFVNEVKVGETVSTVTVADGLDDAYLIAYSRKKAIAK